jgi:hypothetical protein
VRGGGEWRGNPVELGKRRSWRVIVAGALVVVPLAACGGGPTAQPQRGVTISDLQHKEYFYQGDYLGWTITDQPAEVTKDEAVRVTGTVGQLHRSMPSEGVPYIQRELYTRHDTDAYLYHATIESPTG